MYAVVRAAARQALGTHNLTPAIDFNADVNIINKLNASPTFSNEQYYAEQFGDSLRRSNLRQWENFFEHSEGSQRVQPRDTGATLRFESAMNAPPPNEEKVIFQLHHKYIVCSGRNGLMVMDQQAAHTVFCLKNLWRD